MPVFPLQMSLYMAIVVYAPALALAQVTGLNVYVSVSLICFVCIFYTTLGGMKAVLWTDAIQVRLVIKGDKCYLSSGKALKIKVVDDVMVWGEHGSRGNDITIAVYYISDIGDEDDDSNNEGNRSNDDENIIGNVANTNNDDVIVTPKTFFLITPPPPQMIIMYGSMMFVIIKGAIDVGGFEYVWQKNVESGRAELVNFDPNPTTRHTFWTLIVGGYFTWITIYGVNQAQVRGLWARA